MLSTADIMLKDSNTCYLLKIALITLSTKDSINYILSTENSMYYMLSTEDSIYHITTKDSMLSTKDSIYHT